MVKHPIRARVFSPRIEAPPRMLKYIRWKQAVKLARQALNVKNVEFSRLPKTIKKNARRIEAKLKQEERRKVQERRRKYEQNKATQKPIDHSKSSRKLTYQAWNAISLLHQYFSGGKISDHALNFWIKHHQSLITDPKKLDYLIEWVRRNGKLFDHWERMDLEDFADLVADERGAVQQKIITILEKIRDKK